MKPDNSYKKLWFAAIFIVIALPMVSNLYAFIMFDGRGERPSTDFEFNRPLRGSYVPSDAPHWSPQNWFLGDLQDTAIVYIDENIFLRNFFVRLYNQLNFSLFQKVLPDVVMGKDGFLFERMDIEISRGREYAGKDTLTRQGEKVKRLQNILKQKDKHLLVVLEPSKSIVKNEYLPDHVNKTTKGISNYNMFTQIFREKAIPFIDLSQYFLAIDDRVPYSLYPKLGSHWTSYGMALSADTILRKLESISGKAIRDFAIDTVITARQPYEAGIDYNSQDYDLSEMLNLIRELEQDSLPYPTFAFSGPEPQYNLLVIGDSYFWQLYLSGIVDSVFADHSFWYYYSTVYAGGTQQAATPDLLRQKLAEADFVVIMQSIGGLRKLGFGFVEDALVIEKESAL